MAQVGNPLDCDLGNVTHDLIPSPFRDIQQSLPLLLFQQSQIHLASAPLPLLNALAYPACDRLGTA